MDSEFLSTPSARRATEEIPYSKFTVKISIHALREEGDTMSRPKPPVRRHFYPRPPRGGRPSIFAKYFRYEPFLSTPSARRATGFASRVSESYAFLSTPSARRATTAQLHQSLHQAISIHALREEGDDSAVAPIFASSNFYPRPPRGGRHALLGVVFIKLVFLSTPSARRATRSPPQLRDF